MLSLQMPSILSRLHWNSKTTALGCEGVPRILSLLGSGVSREKDDAHMERNGGQNKAKPLPTLSPFPDFQSHPSRVSLRYGVQGFKVSIILKTRAFWPLP